MSQTNLNGYSRVQGEKARKFATVPEAPFYDA